MSDYFAVGATVFMESGIQSKVTKVLKNGNVKIEHSTYQFSIMVDKTSAWQTGTAWRKEFIYADTESNRENAKRKIALAYAKQRIRNEVARLQNLLETKKRI